MVLSGLIFVLVLYAWLSMMLGGEGTLAQKGLGSLKYFTVDSNLIMGAAALNLVLQDRAVLRSVREEVPASAVRLYYAGAVSVTLTFLVTVLFLSRIFGLWVLYVGANFWMHLVVPLLGLFVFCVYVRDCRIDVKDSLTALVPLGIYAVYYVGMILKYGLEDPRTDWYYFCFAGIRTLPVVLIVIFFVTWGTALLMRKAVNRK